MKRFIKYESQFINRKILSPFNLFRRPNPDLNISEQQIRGVKIRMECRGTEDIQKESLYLEISDTGKVQASHDGNSDQTVMVLVPVGMAFNMHLTYSDYHMFIIHCLNITMLCYHMYAQNESQFED